MKNPEAPRRIQRDISVQQVGTETLVYDESCHKAFCLNQSSAVIWRLSDGERGVVEMSSLASLELGVPVDEDFVVFAVEQLREDGLIEPSTLTAGGPKFSRRAMLQKLGVGGAILLPAVAAIVAPTAAQAYSGCVDCTPSSQTVRARAKKQQPVPHTASAKP